MSIGDELAADLHVPIIDATGYTQFDKMLGAYPRTNFIGHGDLFWAHISLHDVYGWPLFHRR